MVCVELDCIIFRGVVNVFPRGLENNVVQYNNTSSYNLSDTQNLFNTFVKVESFFYPIGVFNKYKSGQGL